MSLTGLTLAVAQLRFSMGQTAEVLLAIFSGVNPGHTFQSFTDYPFTCVYASVLLT